jgi:hypothetical protein
VSDEPAKDEPAKDEPAKDEPAKDEPAKDEPAKGEPAKDEPAKDEPAKDEPAKGEPTKDEPTPGKGSEAASPSRVITLLGHADVTAWVRRKVVVFRRLEPSDTRTPGSLVVEESPYLEANVVELRIPKKSHEELRALFAKRREALSITQGLLRSYDPAGWLVAGGGGGLVGVWLDYLPFAFLWPLVATVAVGVAVGVATRMARATAEKEADARWKASPAKSEHDALARELAEAWASAQATLKRETGFHTVIRVAEGSVDPLRLASIDPRPYSADPPIFDPDDFLPSEDAGAIRYEQVHATGEVVTRALDGTNDFKES